MPPGEFVAGVDEAGKGDFFGSLVIAALVAGQDDLAALHELGVRDSKKIAPRKLLGIDERLRATFPHALVIVPPAEYNKRYDQIRNLNKLLAEGHAEAIQRVCQQTTVDRAISDKFGKPELIEDALVRCHCNVSLQQLVRGEAVPQVAAASILARAAFVREMDRLSEMVGFDLPKGAAPLVDRAGRELVAQHGIEILETTAKLHFKNYQRVVNPTFFS